MALLSDKFKLKPQLSGADIKSLYEAEADTNAYTTTEKNKLAGIADGAEVNVNADWNAVSGDAQILNKPTLGTAAATDSTDYATAAQGALADTALQPSALNNTALTGIPTAPTAPEGTDTTQIATTAFVNQSAVETIIILLSDNITPVQAQAGIEKFTLRYNFTIEKVWFETAYQAPTGSNAIVRVLNGTTNIFTSVDALAIAAGNTSVGPLIPDTTYHPVGSVLNFDITQVGATNTGLGYRVTLQGVRS